MQEFLNHRCYFIRIHRFTARLNPPESSFSTPSYAS